jgi:hypothetical protein
VHVGDKLGLILGDDGEPTRCSTLESFNCGIERRRILKEDIGDYCVSTVLLPVEYHDGIFETMVFDGCRSVHCSRCFGARADAVAMHERVVSAVKQWKRKESELC